MIVQKCFEAMIFKKILARKYIFQQSKLYQIKKFYTYINNDRPMVFMKQVN